MIEIFLTPICVFWLASTAPFQATQMLRAMIHDHGFKVGHEIYVTGVAVTYLVML